MSNKSFGGKDRYYSETHPEASQHNRQLSETEHNLKNALILIDPEIQERIERSFRQWNTIIREQLRNEMGLRLTVEGKYQAVPISIVDGLSHPLHGILQQSPSIYWKLLFRKRLLEDTTSGMSFILNNFHEMTNELKIKSSKLIPRHLTQSSCYIDSILKSIEKTKIFNKVLAIDHDILGAYFYNQRKIELYWMSIGLIAGGLGIRPEALAIVVAIHELAHAYSHLGNDIDGAQWDTKKFSKSDIHIVEGIAQYYTEAVCRNLETRFPDTIMAFSNLLKKQATPYTHFKKWSLPETASGEIVRLSMIACRSQGLTEYKDFLTVMRRYKNLKQTIPKRSKPA